MIKILVVFTGGTIGCAPPKAGVLDNENDGKDLALKTWEDYYLLTNYVMHNQENYQNYCIVFDTIEPFHTLSENITIGKWNALISVLKTVDFSQYSGVVITHGTDTLAYTSSLFGILLSHLKLPIIFVSSQAHLKSPLANGHKNFEDAVNFICRQAGKTCGVYVAYSYDLKITQLYIATQIRQSQAIINKYQSFTGYDFGYIENGIFYVHDIEEARNFIPKNNIGDVLSQIDKLDSCIVIINPYVGLDYSCFNLSTRVKAVLHNTYHTFAVCVENDNEIQTSAKSFFEECQKNNIAVYFSPFNIHYDIYASTNIMKKSGAKFIEDSSLELSYAKLLIGYSLFKSQKEIDEFLKEAW